jgi:hypothetical protein
MAFRGLNIQLAMNDVDNAAAALINLGLDQRDLVLISGLTSNAGVEQTELHTLSGLVVDQKKELASLARSSTTVGNLLTGLKDIGQPLDFNLEIDNQINAAAIKYNYLDFSNPSGPPKIADISTSRVSSWSTIGSSILYGGEVEVSGDNVTFTSLSTASAPIGKTFRAEVATHKLKIKINGTDKEFLAMKGIPLEWDAFFRNVNLQHAVTSVSDSIGVVPPVWRITNKAGGQSYNTGDANGSIGAGTVGTPATYAFKDSSSKARKIEFFYNPLNILELRMAGCNLTKWTNIGLDNLDRVDINNNDFYELPKFGPASRNGDGLAVNLKHINMSANNLSRAEDSSGNQIPANTQLNTLPITLTNLTMNGVFSDNTTIDLTDYVDLSYLQFQTYYSRNAQRRMTGGTISPKTVIDSNSIKGISQYRIYHQPYSQLDAGVCASPNLTYLYFPWCGITTAENRTSGSTQAISIASNNIGEFISYGNAHNVVNMSGKTSLTNYVQAYSSPGSDKSRNLAGQFNGCAGLTQIYCYASSTIQANIQTAFSNQSLSSLSTLDLRWTSASGELRDASFSGADALVHIRFAGGGHSGTDFYGTADSIANNSGNGEVFANMSNLNWLYVYSNGNISGALPDFSNNSNMRGIYIRNTSTNGNLPNLTGNPNLYYLRLDSNQMTGTVPTWSSNALRYVFCYNNSITGSLPALNTPYLYYLYLQNNNILGNLPSMAGAIRLQRLYLNSNNLTGYTADALKYNTSLSIIDLSNNSLPASVGSALINDLWDNYAGNPRSGVSVNLLGNNGLSRSNIINDGTEGENSTASKLEFIERFWTVLLD